MKTKVTLHQDKKILATFQVTQQSSDAHSIDMHAFIQAGEACLLHLESRELTKVLNLTETVPYVFLYFDKALNFAGATFSLNASKAPYLVKTEAKKVLALPFPSSFDSSQIHSIKRVSIKE